MKFLQSQFFTEQYSLDPRQLLFWKQIFVIQYKFLADDVLNLTLWHTYIVKDSQNPLYGCRTKLGKISSEYDLCGPFFV